jgi:hypothetical protein
MVGQRHVVSTQHRACCGSRVESHRLIIRQCVDYVVCDHVEVGERNAVLTLGLEGAKCPLRHGWNCGLAV